MAKLPSNRYQTVAELIEDLTIASGTAQFAPVPAPAGPVSAPVTDEPDEVTVVRPREEPLPPQRVQRHSPVTVPVQGETSGSILQAGSMPSGAMPPPAASSFNPLKVIIPSIVGLLVVFAVIYALKSNSLADQPNANANQPQETLAADPNSQPVQPGPSPTGKGEQGIPAGGSIAAPAANVSASPNANADVSPEPAEEVSPPPPANANANSNSNTNSNSNRKAPALPEPTRTVLPENVPSPAATKTPEQKASPVPTPTPPQPL
jgi:hypothetical protein